MKTDELIESLRHQLEQQKNKANELYDVLDEICYKYGSNAWSYESRKKVLDTLRKYNNDKKLCEEG